MNVEHLRLIFIAVSAKYFGLCFSHDTVSITGVQYILDTVTQELLNDPQKRFVYVEQAFFYRWWNELHDATRHLIKGLVNAG